MRKTITGLAIVALVAGVALVAVSLSQAPSAFAQETEDAVFFQPLEDVLDDLVEDDVINQEQRDKIAQTFEDRMVRFGRGFRGTPHLETVAEVLEMDVDELVDQLRDGSTIADVAGDQTQDVIDALVDEQATRIDDALADGRISEESATEIRTALAEHIEAMVNGERQDGIHPFGMDHMRGPGGFFEGPRGLDFFGGPKGFDRFGIGGPLGLDSIAETLGLEADELMERLADGSSLAEIAKEQGVEIQDIVDTALAGLDQHLDELVADKKLTRQRADEIRDGLAAGIESMITGDMPGFGGLGFEFKPDGGEGFPHFGGRGHGMPGPGGGFPFPRFFGGPDDGDAGNVNGTGTSA